jgi:adenosylcobinamide-GDP ribazoletransferase
MRAVRNLYLLLLNGLRGCAAAFQFLTRLPIPVKLSYDEHLFKKSVVFYPFVGAVIGALLAAAGWGLQEVLPPLPSAALLLIVWVALTGGLHLDGLMDTADGLLSHRSREEMLEIMKDPRTGAMGVIVCVLQLLIKFALIYTMITDTNWPKASMLLAIVPLWSRSFMVAAIACWPYARRGSGLGSYFRGVRLVQVVAAGVIAAMLSLCVWALANAAGGSVPLLSDWFWITLCAFGITALAGWLQAAWMHRKLGGLTGDTYGALNEILETVLLLSAVICL